MEKVNGNKENVILCASLPDAFASVAMTYPEKDMGPGKLVRFSTHGTPGDTTGWCKLFADGVGAAFGANRRTHLLFGNSAIATLHRPASRNARQYASSRSRSELAAQHANAATVAALHLDSWFFCLLECGLGSCDRNAAP